MRCEDALLLISGHLDKMNTAQEEADLQAHLLGCEDCRNILEAFKEADSGVASLKENAPSDFCTGVMSQIKKEATKKKRRPWYGIAVAAALMLVVGVSAAMDLPEDTGEPETASVAQNTAVTRSAPAADGGSLARKIADERGAPVVVVRELYYEIETCPCETLDEGYLLYELPDRDTAVTLGENYGCVIYHPSEDTGQAAAFALLMP